MKILAFTPTGVCFNCLNGKHTYCHDPVCQCSQHDHRGEWWFRDDGITDEHTALMKDRLIPTPEGFLKYTQGFYEGIPCTCKGDCGFTCKGQCGCDACRSAYEDFLSCE